MVTSVLTDPSFPEFLFTVTPENNLTKPLAAFSVIPLPNNKILDWTSFKAFADNKLDNAKMMIPVFDTEKNSIFSISHSVFKKPLP